MDLKTMTMLASIFALLSCASGPLVGRVVVMHPLHTPVQEESWAWATIHVDVLEDPGRGLDQRAMIRTMTRDLVVVYLELEHTNPHLANVEVYQGFLRDNNGLRIKPISTRIQNRLDRYRREIEKPFWARERFKRSWVRQSEVVILSFYRSSAIFTFRGKDLVRDTTKWLSFEVTGPQELNFVVHFESR